MIALWLIIVATVALAWSVAAITMGLVYSSGTDFVVGYLLAACAWNLLDVANEWCDD